jgi:hypothetical protein
LRTAFTGPFARGREQQVDFIAEDGEPMEEISALVPVAKEQLQQ